MKENYRIQYCKWPNTLLAVISSLLLILCREETTVFFFIHTDVIILLCMAVSAHFVDMFSTHQLV